MSPLKLLKALVIFLNPKRWGLQGISSLKKPANSIALGISKAMEGVIFFEKIGSLCRFLVVGSVSIIFITVFIVGCATNSQSRWAVMGIAAPIGAGVGALSVPEDEKPEFHALTWGAIFVAAAAIAGGYYYNDDKEIERLRGENERLRVLTKSPKFEFITEGQGYFKETFSKGEKKPVKWKVYKMDRWIPDGEDRKYHQDMMIERVERRKENGIPQGQLKKGK